MPSRRSTALAAVLAVLAAGLIAACGSSGSGKQATASTPVNQLLRDTFSGSKKVTSGKLSLALDVAVKGGTTTASGPVHMRLSGPFESQGDAKLPKFAMAASLQGGGQSFQAGATSTGDKGFVAFQGTNYAVSAPIFQQFRTGYEQAQRKARDQRNGGTSLATLGIDPRRWLKDARNAGDAKVGDTDTIRITGAVDVPKLLDDLDAALAKASALGVQGGQQLPQRLTPAQKQEAIKAIKHVDVEIFTGKDDRMLRRMLVKLGLQQGAEASDVAFDLTLTDVNQGQDIAAPANARPFDELASKLGGLNSLLGGAAAGGSASGSGSGSSPGSSPSGSAAGADALKNFSDCVEKAGQDQAKARKCADLLGTP